MNAVPSSVHDELVARLRYFDGHSDTLGLFADGDFLARAASSVADPFRGGEMQLVVGIEARGFVLAVAVALELRAGFVAVRKPGGIPRGAARRSPLGASSRPAAAATSVARSSSTSCRTRYATSSRPWRRSRSQTSSRPDGRCPPSNAARARRWPPRRLHVARPRRRAGEEPLGPASREDRVDALGVPAGARVRDPLAVA